MSDFFAYKEGRLCAERLDVAELAARYGTPLYIYSAAALSANLCAWQTALGERGAVCYAVKANSNLGVLSLLAARGCGFDIVSGGELERVLAAGGHPKTVVFSGVGKTAAELEAALRAGIGCFNLESAAELEMLNEAAGALGVQAPVAVRLNPDVNANTHPYIATGLRENKFGIDMAQAREVYARARDLPHIRVLGAGCHIGSQLTEIAPFEAALERILCLVDALAADGIELEHLDIGGGLGVAYRDEVPPAPADLCAALLERLGGRRLRLVVEPGRSIAANAGILVTQVLLTKQTGVKNFAVVDAGMNDLLRPALYQAWMRIIPVLDQPRPAAVWDIVGPVCESGDFLGKDRTLGLAAGDLLCVRGAGAYSFCLSSNYNSRSRAAELMVCGERAQIVRQRETVADLLRGECPFALDAPQCA